MLNFSESTYNQYFTTLSEPKIYTILHPLKTTSDNVIIFAFNCQIYFKELNSSWYLHKYLPFLLIFFHSWYPSFLLVFFCLKNILKQNFRCGLWAMNTLSFPLSEYVPMSLSSLKNIWLVIYNSFLSACWNGLSLSPLLHGFWWKILNHWIQCSLIGNMSFFSGCFQYFFLDFGCQIYYDMSRYGFLSF